MQAMDLHKKGEWQAAQVLYLGILDEQISHPVALHNLGLIYIRNYHFPAGNAMLQRSLQLMPDWIEGYYNYALVLFEQKHFAHAIEIAEKILSFNPANVNVLILLIDACIANNQPDRTIQYAQQLAKIQTKNLDLQERIVNFLIKEKRYPEALKQIDVALTDFPKHAPLHKFKALCLYQQFQLDQAKKSCYRALTLDGDLELMNFLLGNIFHREENFPEAAAHYRQELTRHPQHPQIQLALAQSLLRQGNYSEGLSLLESRQAFLESRYPHIPRWRGGEIKKNILIFADDGLGKNIMWLRYLPIVAHRLRNDAKIYLELPDNLVPLVQESSLAASCTLIFGRNNQDAIIKAQLSTCEQSVSLSSLGFLMGTRTDSVPQSKRYLHVQLARVTSLLERMGSYGQTYSYSDFSTQAIKIGIDFGNDKNPIPFTKWRGIIQAYPKFSFYNLSDYTSSPELIRQDVNYLKAAGEIEDYSEVLPTTHDLACFIANLDIVISSDENTAHLACALGITSIYLSNTEVDWVWQTEQMKSLWYPENLQLIKQTSYKDWTGPLQQVQEMLNRVYQKQFETRVA